jgi:apolipoprotein N-acyltransferase
VDLHGDSRFRRGAAWLALFLLAALLAIKGAYYALLGYVLVRIAPDPSPSRSLLLIPAGWTLLEWLRGWLFTGFPWLQLGYAHSDTPLAALSTVGGIHLVTFAAALTASAIVVVFHPGSPEIRGDRTHGARLGVRLAAHRARVDQAREQAGHRCAAARRYPAEREMARRKSRGDARQVP